MAMFGFLNDERRRFPWVPALIIYTLSYFMMFFFLDAKFWDDWMVNIQMTPSEAHQYWKDMIAMFPTNRFIEISLLGRNPTAMHLLTFVMHFVNGFLVFQILKKVKFLNHATAASITLVFLVIPINSARVAMVDFRYTYSLTLFFLGWFLLLQNKYRFLQLISVPIFISSFIVQSLLVFLIAPCIHLFLVNNLEIGLSKIRSSFYSFSLLAIAPTYFVLVRLLDPPISSRIEYYTPSFGGTSKALIFLFLSSCWLIINVKKSIKILTFGRQLLIAIGVFLISLGAFAYMAADNLSDISEWMLNFVPRASDWDSRHQLLLGLGFACVVVGLIGELNSKSKMQLFFLVIAGCVGLNVLMMKSYFLDWRKQVGVIQLIQSGEFETTTKVIEVLDDVSAKRFNARGRSIRDYEWEALIQYASGRKDLKVQTRTPFGCPESSIDYPDTLLRIEATNSDWKSIFSGNPNVVISLHAITKCEK